MRGNECSKGSLIVSWPLLLLLLCLPHPPPVLFPAPPPISFWFPCFSLYFIFIFPCLFYSYRGSSSFAFSTTTFSFFKLFFSRTLLLSLFILLIHCPSSLSSVYFLICFPSCFSFSIASSHTSNPSHPSLSRFSSFPSLCSLSFVSSTLQLLFPLLHFFSRRSSLHTQIYLM